jgi:uncharacterized SAM-binding protein YcdF (DUF218 family)
MFYFKKLVGGFLQPVPLCVFLLLLGLVLLWFTKRQKSGKILVTLGAIALTFVAGNWGAALLVAPLENAYPPLLDTAEILQLQESKTPVRWIVVLGGGYNSDSSLPVTSRLSDASLMRLVEGIRLHRMLPDTKLLLSEGSVTDPVPGAEVFAELAQDLGVPRDSIVLDTESLDTKDQARLIGKVVGKDRFILVTSATHMRRSVSLFHKRGLEPITAPTDHALKLGRGFSLGRLLPGSGGLLMTECSIHEYLGLLWAKLRGQV